MTKKRGGALLALALISGAAIVMTAATTSSAKDVRGTVVVWPEEDQAGLHGRVRRQQLASRDDCLGARRG